MNKTRRISCASDSRNEPPLDDGSAGQGAQASIEFIDAFEQIECESGAGKVNPKVALQVQRDAGAPQAAGGKVPVPAVPAGRFQDAVLHHGLDELAPHIAASTKLPIDPKRIAASCKC